MDYDLTLFPDLKSLAESEYLFRIVDNCGETIDRLTVVFSDGDYLAMSWTGQGFSQWSQGCDPGNLEAWIEAKEQIDLGFGERANAEIVENTKLFKLYSVQP